MTVDVNESAPGFGTIVAGRASSGEFDEVMTKADAISCDAYVQCLLGARIGEQIPISSDQTGYFELEQSIVYAWASASRFDPARVRQLIEMDRIVAERLFM